MDTLQFTFQGTKESEGSTRLHTEADTRGDDDRTTLFNLFNVITVDGRGFSRGDTDLLRFFFLKHTHNKSKTISGNSHRSISSQLCENAKRTSARCSAGIDASDGNAALSSLIFACSAADISGTCRELNSRILEHCCFFFSCRIHRKI